MFARHPALSRRVLVNMFSGNAIEGVLTDVARTRDGVVYVVRAAMVHEPGTEPTQADGELMVNESNVDYIQTL